MSKSLWSGNRPKTDAEAKMRIGEAALACIKRSGYSKTSMSDIARETGIARPTLYKHYKNKDDIFFDALDFVALTFTQSVVEHARKFADFEQRVVESIIYVVTAFPAHPYLPLAFDTECSTVLKGRVFSDDPSQIFSQMTAEPLIEVRPELAEKGAEITEVMSRFAISMIIFPGKYASDHESLRDLIKTRVLPGLLQ